MSKSEPLLKIENLTKTYGSLRALDDVSLDIAKGEFVTLLGPSGSGKTTLLNIIAGGMEPTSGTVHLAGKDITRMPARHRGIGMVFQNFALMPHLTVFDNLAFPLQIRKVPRAEIRDRVEEVLELVRLPQVQDRKPKQMSGGQQQRIAIARALIYRPPLILMDEPLGALDKKLRQQMQLEIKRIHDGLNLSMIYVTHDQEEALVMSDRICLMGSGRIREAASPARIYSAPRSEFCADFFGATNIFKGNPDRSAAGTGLSHPHFGLIRADNLPEVPAGTELGWMVRPERLRLLSRDETADNMLAGRVSDIILSGPITQLIVDVGDGHQFNIACLTSEEVASLREHEEIRFGWSRHATIVFDGSAP